MAALKATLAHARLFCLLNCPPKVVSSWATQIRAEGSLAGSRVKVSARRCQASMANRHLPLPMQFRLYCCMMSRIAVMGQGSFRLIRLPKALFRSSSSNQAAISCKVKAWRQAKRGHYLPSDRLGCPEPGEPLSSQGASAGSSYRYSLSKPGESDQHLDHSHQTSPRPARK